MSERADSGALALGVLAAALAVLPAVARVLGGGVGQPAVAALLLWGSGSLVVVPLSLWLRRARLAGLPRSDQALLAGAALSALPLALCGGVLKSTTHHRPLGGATFAVASLCLLALCIGLAFRALRSTPHADRSAWQNLFLVGCGLSLLSVVALGFAGAARPSLIDGAALLGAASLAARCPLPDALRRVPRWPVLLGWLALVGFALLAPKTPQLVRSLNTLAPVCFAPLSWLGAGS